MIDMVTYTRTIKVPYWHQTSEASCGPCCLLMLFNYFSPKYKLSRKKEWELWRETSLLSWRGVHPYGLATATLRKGFKVTLIRERKTMWKDPKFPKNNESLRYILKIQEKEAKRLGLREKIVKKIQINHLKQILHRNLYPIVLMRFVKKNGCIGWAHWVIILKIGKDHVILHDPYVRSNRKLAMKLFMKGWNNIRMKKWEMNKEILIVEK